MVVRRSPCATLGGDSPDLQVGVAATFVGGLLEPQLRREATNAAVTEAAAAEMRRRRGANAASRRSSGNLVWRRGAVNRCVYADQGSAPAPCSDRYNIIDEQDLARGVAK